MNRGNASARHRVTAYARPQSRVSAVSDEERIVQILLSKQWHIAFAESCTGGMAVSRIVSVPNASRVLDVSFVTYAPEAKTRYLGVSPETIASYDVVSEPVAAEMAKGVAERADAQVGVSITGYAGPGGTDRIPAGTVCFGFFIHGTVTTRTAAFGDLGRNVVRRCAVDFALHHLAGLLEELSAE